MIKRITIKKLFGYFNHAITLNLEERLTIIHGPNGCGKTTILKLLSDVFSRNFRSLMATPYDTITLDFTDRSSLRIRRKEGRRRWPEAFSLARMQREVGVFLEEDILRSARIAPEQELSTVSLDFVFRKPGLKKPKSHSFRQYGEFEVTLGLSDFIEHRIPFLERVGPSSWVDTRTGSRLDREQVMILCARKFGYTQYYEPNIPSWLVKCMQSVKTEFIETQRLLAPQPQQRERSRREEIASAVLMYSQELAKTIQDTLAKSAALSQGMDRGFPRRVLTEHMPDVKEADIRQKYVEQAEKSKRLMEAGLIDKEPDVALPAKALEVLPMRWTDLGPN